MTTLVACRGLGLLTCLTNRLSLVNGSGQLGHHKNKSLHHVRLLSSSLCSSSLCSSSASSLTLMRRWLSESRCVAQKEKMESSTLSLAEQVLQERRESESNKSEEQKSEEAQSKGPEPLSKAQKLGYVAFAVLVFGGSIVSAITFSLPDKDETGNVVVDEFSSLSFPVQHYRRLKARIFATKRTLEEPFSDKLLPDPLPEPYHQPKYTVLVELTGLLVHSNWTHKHGWRFQKRPGVDMFISQVGYPHFELVVYTTENAMTFYPIVDGLDPNGQFIMYRLFRDATRYLNGHHTKDLKALNRDLSKVIVVDWNSDSVALDRNNALILKKWQGDPEDRTLIGLAQLLQAISQSDVDDVREVLDYYKQFEDPIEAFRENQRKLQVELAAEEERRKESQQQRVSSPTSLFSFIPGFRSR